MGQLRLWQADHGLSEPIEGVPKVYTRWQGGLLDVALAPDFAQNRHVYLSYAEEGKEGRAGTAVGYGRLSDNKRRSEEHTSELQSLMRISYAVFCLKKKNRQKRSDRDK